MDNLTAKLYQSSQTVFTNKDLAIIWNETNSDNLKSKISYYVKTGVLIRLTRGVFAKDDSYNPKELVTGLYLPSYISFETVLREEGVVFQHYDTIFAAGPWSKTIEIGQTKIVFRRLKKTVLFNNSGVIFQDNYSTATVERALLDTLYLFPSYYFDNLKPIDWNKCQELSKIYQNKQLIKRMNKLFNNLDHA